MGTDITMFAEVRKNKKWTKVGDVFKNPWYHEDGIIDKWNQPYTDHPYDGRNYDLFAILADVRNGTGFAGCKTSYGFNPISEPKGLPEDVTDEVRELLWDDGYANSYDTLKELKDYDWNQIVTHVGVISEVQYVEMKRTGENPESWSGDVSGWEIVVVSADTMDKILNKTISRNDRIKYYVQVDFNPITYRECCDNFLEDTIPALEELIPADGTEEDVRIIFNFDC